MRRLAISACLLLGCVEPGALAPQPSAVVPDRAVEGATAQLEIQGDRFLAGVVTDFGAHQHSTLDAAFSVSLLSASGEALALDQVQLVDAHRLTAIVSGAPRGLYDVKVVSPSGAEGTLLGAFRVVTSAENVDRFELDPLDVQHLGIPFAVGITAIDEQGRTVEGFTGAVKWQDSTATLTPADTGSFVRGRYRAYATISKLAVADLIQVADALGHVGTSAPFDVVQGLSTQLVFTAGPDQTVAGTCAGPLELGVRDALGAPAVAAAPLDVALTANPPEATVFFSDPACMTATGALTVAAGQGGSQFFVRPDRSGAVTLRAQPNLVPSVSRPLAVMPGPAVALKFASPAQVLKAGDCSAALEIEATDALGNAAPLASPTQLAVSAEPPTGVMFFADVACSATLNAVSIGAQGVSVFFRAAAPGTFDVQVSAMGLGVAAQSEEVTP